MSTAAAVPATPTTLTPSSTPSPLHYWIVFYQCGSLQERFPRKMVVVSDHDPYFSDFIRTINGDTGYSVTHDYAILSCGTVDPRTTKPDGMNYCYRFMCTATYLKKDNHRVRILKLSQAQDVSCDRQFGFVQMDLYDHLDKLHKTAPPWNERTVTAVIALKPQLVSK